MADSEVVATYLHELRVGLGPAAEHAEPFVEEVNDHLLSAVEAAVANGVSEPTAAVEAVARFGSPAVVAAAWLTQRRHSTATRATVLSLVFTTAAVALHSLAETPVVAATKLLMQGVLAALVVAVPLAVSRRHVPLAAPLMFFGAICIVSGTTLQFTASGPSVLTVAAWFCALISLGSTIWRINWARLTTQHT